MKLDIHYVSDSEGNPQAVQLPIEAWNRVVSKLKKYERTLQVKSDLEEAFMQVDQLRKKKAKKKTLSQFLDEL
ncbi:MAG TPA: hypothetical protein VF609_03795 [Flavisolibacter sp.]|jgi:hypothetical protein